MFNEPDHSSAGGLTQAQYLERLQLSSDAIQCALADVNALDGRSLTPTVLAPVITTPSYNSWGQQVGIIGHVKFFGPDRSAVLAARTSMTTINTMPPRVFRFRTGQPAPRPGEAMAPERLSR
jgi:hypothetical protein